MRRVVSMILVLVMLLAAMPATAMAATEDLGDLTWISADGTEYSLTVFTDDEVNKYNENGQRLNLFGLKQPSGEIFYPADIAKVDICNGTNYIVIYLYEMYEKTQMFLPIMFDMKTGSAAGFWEVQYIEEDGVFIIQNLDDFYNYYLTDVNLNVYAEGLMGMERISNGKYLAKYNGIYEIGKGYLTTKPVTEYIADGIYVTEDQELILEDGTVVLDFEGKELTYEYSDDKASWIVTVDGEEQFLDDLLAQSDFGDHDFNWGSPFKDVAIASYYFLPVLWAVGDNITAGTSDTTFSPNQTCTRAQILTFLWKAAGRPEPTIDNPFADVSETNYYYKPALWAYEYDMVNGTLFDAKAPCTRGDSVTYIWKALGKLVASEDSGFVDIEAGSECERAAAWAKEAGVTSGTSNTTFSPKKSVPERRSSHSYLRLLNSN